MIFYEASKCFNILFIIAKLNSYIQHKHGHEQLITIVVKVHQIMKPRLWKHIDFPTRQAVSPAKERESILWQLQIPGRSNQILTTWREETQSDSHSDERNSGVPYIFNYSVWHEAHRNDYANFECQRSLPTKIEFSTPLNSNAIKRGNRNPLLRENLSHLPALWWTVLSLRHYRIQSKD